MPSFDTLPRWRPRLGQAMAIYFATAAADAASANGIQGDTLSFANADSRNVISLNIWVNSTKWAAGDTISSQIDHFQLSNYGDFFCGDGRSVVVYGGERDQGIYLLINPGSSGRAIGGAGSDTFFSSAGFETFDGRGEGFDGDTVAFNPSSAGIIASLADQSINTGEAAGDRYIDIENLQGSNFNDVLYSVADGRAHQLIGDPEIGTGFGGDDTLYGATGPLAGYTNFIPGAGRDVIHLGDGGNQLDYEIAATGLTVSLIDMSVNTGDAAGDVLIGGHGQRIDLCGTPFSDLLIGDDGPNNIMGDPLNPGLYGNGGGDDRLMGLGGDDLLIGGPGADTLDGGSGDNLAVYAHSLIGLTVDLAHPDNNTGQANGDVYINIQGLMGSNFDDLLRGNAGNNRLFGNAGNDTLSGGSGDDLLNGGLGADHFDGGDGFDYVFYANSATALTADLSAPQNSTGEASGDTYALSTLEGVWGSDFGDVITAGGFPMFLNGSLGDDTLRGGTGDDGLCGGVGADLIRGGAGADHFAYFSALESTAQAADTIADFETGRDTVDLWVSPSGLIINRMADGRSVLQASMADVQFRINFLTGINGTDISGLTEGIRLVGSSLAETLQGSSFGDVILGGGGADTITGGGGADTFRYLLPSDSSDAAPDVIQDFQTGIDRLDLGALGATSVSIAHRNGGTTLIATGDNGTTVIKSLTTVNRSDIVGHSGGVQVAEELSPHRGGAQAAMADIGSSSVGLSVTFADDSEWLQFGGTTLVIEGLTDLALTDGMLGFGADSKLAGLARIYHGVLGRAPTGTEMMNGKELLDHGGHLTQIASDLLHGQEFAAHARSHSVAADAFSSGNTEFLQMMYRLVLHRDPDAAGLEHWRSCLDRGLMSRADAVLGFTNSAEAKVVYGSSTEALWAVDLQAYQLRSLYDVAFGREPDAGGLDYWSSLMDRGMSIGVVADCIIQSSEFQARIAGLGTTQILQQFYQDGLERTPDAPGLAYWTQVVDGGHGGWSTVLLGFSLSDEQQDQFARYRGGEDIFSA